MPRTKRRKASERIISSSKRIKLEKKLLELMDQQEKGLMAELESLREQELEELRMIDFTHRAKFRPCFLKRTLTELKSGAVCDTISSALFSTVNSRVKRLCRSRSEVRNRPTYKINEDEGYTTAESGRDTSGARTRGNKGTAKTCKVSRSLSRNAKTNSYKTPANTKVPSDLPSSITPKVKHNIPQVILRRPKQGEMALSYQGSPLLTGPVTKEGAANVNIPLPDGNMLSLMPEHGLRTSLIPDVGTDVIQQLQILRDNLIQVCNNL
ncbi:uncharacterized protein LOC132698479 [Cylas formicarius]|uniref:uncharacterized protein LOC132698479 n=1 Tax=Cylas formicarius TaxID=197179 RepID=UPI0029584D34|nr:uncharacterized protein LOC132698479 [Cylas formicarius]